MSHRVSPACSIAAAILLFTTCQQSVDAFASSPVPPADASSDSAPDPSREASTGDHPDISRIVSPRSIGSSRDFLERTLGQPVDETPETAYYAAGGCDVTVDFAEDGAVSAVSVALEDGCRFDASGLAPGTSIRVDGALSFARFEQAFGNARYSSPCLASCGNAFDSYVDAVVPGNGATGTVDIGAQTLFVVEDAVEASGVWQEQLTAENDEDFVIDTTFNCEEGHDRIPRVAFAQVRVERLRFGRNLGTTDCS
jgi:hypothetical protein